MLAFVVASATCWLCVLVGTPRKPLPGDEVAEFAHVHLLGRQQRVVVLAVAATLLMLGAFLVSIPQRAQIGASTAPGQQSLCTESPDTLPTCYTPQPGGTWQVEAMQADGKWLPVGVVRHPPSSGELDRSAR